MTVVGIVYLCALAALAVGLAVSPEHSYRGKAATLNIYSLLASGAVLAVHALS